MNGKRAGRIIGGILLVTFALLTGACALYEPVVTPNPEAYYHFSVTLAGAPEIVKASRRPADLVFRFREYPGFSFRVQRSYCRKTTEELNTGDTANIMLLNEEYRRTIGHEGNFFEHLVTRMPNLYGLNTGGQDHINLDKIAAGRLDPAIAYMLTLIVITLLVYNGLKLVFTVDDNDINNSSK